MRDTTLCFPVNAEGNILLGRKKRGFGVTKWNGFGGKIETGETFRQCAVRELWEETGLRANENELELVGLLDFQFAAKPEWNHLGYVYFVHRYDGVPKETEEMQPAWFGIHTLPYDEMWKGDRIWIPMILQGKKIQGTVLFAADNDTVQDIHIEETDYIQE